MAQGRPGDAGPADRVAGLHRLCVTHHPPHRADAGQHAGVTQHLHGHAVLAGVPAGQEGSCCLGSRPRGVGGKGAFPVVGAVIQTSSPTSLPTVGCTRAGFR